MGPIDFLFGLPINLIVNAWQNKFEVDILKNVAKIANLRPKIGQIPLLSLEINWHNSIIFYQILTFFILNCFFYETNRMMSKSKLYLFWLRFWCLASFLLRGLKWVKLCAWNQNQPKKVRTCPGLPLQPVSHNQSFQNYRPEPPPPPSGVTTAPATPAMQGGGTLGGRHITEFTVF